MQNWGRLDLRDRRILLELDQTARMSDVEIARRAGLSKESASYRIRRLLSGGTVRGFHAILDTTQLGLHSFRIFLRLQGSTSAQEKEIRECLMASREVSWFSATHGSWKYCVVVTVASAKDFSRFWRSLYVRYGMFFEAKQISELTRMAHFRRDYLVPGTARPAPLEWGKFGRKAFDDTDIRILSALSKDARAPLTEIGAKSGVSHKTVASRMARLERDGVILGYRATLDRSTMGYRYYKVHVDLQHVTRGSLASMSSFLASNPNVFTFIEAVGGYDFEFEMETADEEQVFGVMDAAKARFPELIRNYEVLRYFDEYKVDYLPGPFQSRRHANAAAARVPDYRMHK